MLIHKDGTIFVDEKTKKNNYKAKLKDICLIITTCIAVEIYTLECCGKKKTLMEQSNIYQTIRNSDCFQRFSGATQ